MNEGRLHGKVAVVTGASSGIGAAVAGALAREGARVALAARRPDALREVQDGLVAGARSIVAETDVTDREGVGALVARAERELGPVDFLVNCAGVMYYTLMKNLLEEEWERTVEVNCKGALNCVGAVLPGMLSRESGHIVTISSDAGRKVYAGLAVYSASKFFVEALSQSLRLETAGTGVRVTTIQPGNVDTGLVSLTTDEEALRLYGEPTGARVLDPEDVAASVIYALSQPEHVAVNEILVQPRDEPA
ncbi:MAG: SDR family oxidoreductase [Actinomycetota bacterium]|nr:SDR family oxidoreductase [Actinomycetota bacterium]